MSTDVQSFEWEGICDDPSGYWPTPAYAAGERGIGIVASLWCTELIGAKFFNRLCTVSDLRNVLSS